MGGRRNRPEIVVDLLHALIRMSKDHHASGRVVDVSHRKIMRTANLNYQQLMTYLDWLEEEGLIVVDGEGRNQQIVLTDQATSLARVGGDGSLKRRFLKPVDREILDVLDEGRNTAANIATQHGYERQHVYNRLMWLSENGFVQNLGNGVFESTVEQQLRA